MNPLAIIGIICGLVFVGVLLFLWGLCKAASEESQAEERWAATWKK